MGSDMRPRRFITPSEGGGSPIQHPHPPCLVQSYELSDDRHGKVGCELVRTSPLSQVLRPCAAPPLPVGYFLERCGHNGSDQNAAAVVNFAVTRQRDWRLLSVSRGGWRRHPCRSREPWRPVTRYANRRNGRTPHPALWHADGRTKVSQAPVGGVRVPQSSCQIEITFENWRDGAHSQVFLQFGSRPG